MVSATPPRPPPLTVERIVDAACTLAARDGLAGLSMRRLGAALGVDPMAVYHHVASKRELLTLVTAQTLGSMPPPDRGAPWADQVRQWATQYWDLVVAHRDLTLAGLADSSIAAGGLPSTEPLITAVAASGLPDRATPTPNHFAPRSCSVSTPSSPASPHAPNQRSPRHADRHRRRTASF